MGNTALMVVHDYWSHNAMIPRNRFLGYALDLYRYIITISTMKKFSQRMLMSCNHLYHHRFFEGPNDPVRCSLEHNNWFQYIFICRIYLDKQNKAFTDILSKKDYVIAYNKLDKIGRFMEDHTRIMLAGAHLILLLLLGIKYYMYFVLIPIWYYAIVDHTFVEWTYGKLARDGRNLPYLYPLVLGQAYHNLHHEYPNKIIVGPTPIRYLNPQYWFAKIFFKNREEFI